MLILALSDNAMRCARGAVVGEGRRFFSWLWPLPGGKVEGWRLLPPRFGRWLVNSRA